MGYWNICLMLCGMCEIWRDRVSEVPVYCVLIPMPTPWWRHQMETFSALLAICAGNSPVPGEFLAQRPVTRSFDVFFYLRLNKRLGKQSWGWWFETLPRPLWRHSNVSFCCAWSTDMFMTYTQFKWYKKQNTSSIRNILVQGVFKQCLYIREVLPSHICAYTRTRSHWWTIWHH